MGWRGLWYEKFRRQIGAGYFQKSRTSSALKNKGSLKTDPSYLNKAAGFGAQPIAHKVAAII